MDNGIYIYYKSSDDGIELEYTQQLEDGLSVTLDTEDAEISTKTIYGVRISYFDNKNISYVYWIEGNCYYRVTGKANIEEILKIAESVIK